LRLQRSIALCALALAPCLLGAAKRRKAPKRYPAPKVSAAVREAAAKRVSDRISAAPERPFDLAGALAPFFEMLYRLNRGDTRSVHVLHFGDSHTAADLMTGQLRTDLQRQFGNGGAGFSFPGRPYPGYRRFNVNGGESKRWTAEGLRSGAGDGLFGLGGVSISTDYPGQTVFIEAECERLELFYLEQPGGGRIALYEDGVKVGEFSTDGEMGPAYLPHDTVQGLHRFDIRTLDRAPVRLFGWVTENASGLTYESMGINGAEATLILHWNEPMLASYVARRDPALIVLAYGANEASDSKWNYENYLAAFRETLSRLRSAAPAASILVLGPLDRMSRVKRAWTPLPKLDDIVEAQRDACRQIGCAFWDARERMGGKGSITSWVHAGLAQPDHVHLAGAGYRLLAGALFRDIIQEFQVFSRIRAESSDQVNHEPPGPDPPDYP